MCHLSHAFGDPVTLVRPGRRMRSCGQTIGPALCGRPAREQAGHTGGSADGHLQAYSFAHLVRKGAMVCVLLKGTTGVVTTW